MNTPERHKHKKLPSTQDELRRLALEGAPEGTVVVAEEQTAGRGRLGRIWISPSGGLWFSLLLRPLMKPACFTPFSLVVSLAVIEGIKKNCGIQLNLKWPNDLVTIEFSVQSSEFRKVGGILIENSTSSDGVLEWVTTGIGINVNNIPPATTPIHAANLKNLSGHELENDTLLTDILKEIMLYYVKFKAHGFACMKDNYTQFMILKGKEVRIAVGENIVQGKLIDVDNEGNLMVQSPSALNKISSGEIIP